MITLEEFKLFPQSRQETWLYNCQEQEVPLTIFQDFLEIYFLERKWNLNCD